MSKPRAEQFKWAEIYAIPGRWITIGVGALVLTPRISSVGVLIGIICAAATNLIIQVVQKRMPRNAAASMMRIVSTIDSIVAVSAGLAIPAIRGNHLWLASVPSLIVLAVAQRNNAYFVLTLAAMITARFTAFQFAPGAEFLTDFCVPVAGILMGAAFAKLIVGQKLREDALPGSGERLSTVMECGTALANNGDLHTTMLQTLKAAILETGASCGYIMLIDEEQPDTLRTEVAYGSQGEFAFPECIAVGDGMSGYVAKMMQPISISSSNEEPQEFDGTTQGVRSAISMPLVARTYVTSSSGTEQLLGVLTLMNTNSPEAFDSTDMEMLRTVSSLVAVAVANARMEEKQRSTFLRTLESLATALEARDEYTRGHSQRVSEVSLMIGEKMGLNLDALEELRVGTILHDIGKIGVPDEILNKRDRLTDSEFEVMKTHPVIGYEICRPLRLSEGILLIIRNHHEKLDGSGYPDGLKGGELPLSLRIVCVADAFDAMSSKRPYRGVMELDKVIAEMSRCAGTQFDPVIVENLKGLIDTSRMRDLYKNYWSFPEEQQDIEAAA